MEEKIDAKFYDVVIDAKSFEDLGDSGWEVLLSKAAQEPLDENEKTQMIEDLKKDVAKAKKKADKAEREKQLKETEEKINTFTKYDQWKKQDRPVIGVIGQGNRGKSFILSKVADFQLPTGHNIITKGVSVKYIDFNESNRFILLDSAGSSTPLLETTNFSLDMDLAPEEARKKVNAICRDKTQSEIFLQNFVIEQSNIIIAVIGQMTYSEQKMLNRIKKFGTKTLFVVHNLMNFETKEQVESYIEDTLKNLISCDLKEQTFVLFNNQNQDGNTKYFAESLKMNEEVKQVTHIILARESSEETRKYYNEPGIKYLKQLLEAETRGKRVDIIQKAMEYLAKTSGDFMEKPLVGPPRPKKKKKEEEKEEKKEEKEEKEDEEDKEEEQQNIFYEEVQDSNGVKENKIVVKDTKIQLKKILITEIGESSYLGAGYEPRTSALIKTIGDKKQLVIDLEITGEKPKIKMKFKSEGEYIFFRCKGNKKIPSAPPKSTLSSQHKMKDETINFRFKIPGENINLNKASQKIEYFMKKGQYNGIVRVTYDIEKEDEDPEEFNDL